MTYTAPPAAAFPTDKHIEAAAKLSAAEAKLLSSVKGKIDELNKLAERCSKPKMGQPHKLDDEIHLANVALSENPSAEAAEKLHGLICRKHQSELSASAISDCIAQSVSREIEKLTPLALRILDDAEAAFLAEAQAHKEATKNQTTFSAAAVDFDARIEATRAALAEKRRWVSEENAAGHFLLLELALGVS
ncbi:MAG: hypothetical protein MUF86_00355 [Akkermansiaceae bacterium]|jgi:hypothetical protein|nr:hypothetical protein [Akkermansiaceae bacterium]MCU0776105.1 hypothetical protein [Akkermansiaceae bacterium]